MNFANFPLSLTNSGTTSTAAFETNFVTHISAQAAFSDAAAAGSFKLQASNDPKNPTHWNDVGTPATIAAGALTLLPVFRVGYKWMRATFVSTGGAGTIAIEIQSQSGE